MNESLNRDLRRAIANNDYEKVDGGSIFLPKAKVTIGGYFSHSVRRDGVESEIIHEPNIFVNQGLDHVLDATFSAGTQITAWYIAIFEGNYTPVAGDTASGIAAASTESTAYDEAVRQTWTDGGVSSQSVDNTSSKATFTMNATKTIYGAFMISNSTKSGTTGTLACASAFAASRAVVSGDQLLIAYTLSAADA